MRIPTLGLPHCHVFNSIVGHLAQVYKSGPEKETIDRWIQAAKASGYPLMTHEIKYARYNKCYDSARRRLEINTRIGSCSEAVVETLTKYLSTVPDVRKCEGMAPPGALEEQVQRIVDEEKDRFNEE